MSFDMKVYSILMDLSRAKPSKKNFSKVKEYLDSVGMKMPSPKWVYNEGDKRTWKWLEGRLNVHHFTKKVTHVPEINPDFAYNHLI